MWPGTLTIEGQAYACTILDLSESGARIEARGVQFGPSLAKLESERFGCLEARIQWARGAEAGLHFEAESAAVLERLKPVVPGMGRREKTLAAQPPVLARRSFGRLVRVKSPLPA
jgi:hypothetical protein